MTTIYRIRRKKDGLFSAGGSNPRFNKSGKAWTTIGKLKNHLRLFEYYSGYSPPWPYDDCEIVSYEIVALQNQLDEPLQGVLETYRAINKNKNNH